KGYAEFHLNHEYYNMVFFGMTYWKPPFPRAYAWVMTLATVPTIILLLFAIGLAWSIFARIVPRLRGVIAGARGQRARAHTELFWLLCMLVCYAPWWSTSTPIFGGTKHWMTAYPFLSLFAGVGFDQVRRTLEGWVRAMFAKGQEGGGAV